VTHHRPAPRVTSSMKGNKSCVSVGMRRFGIFAWLTLFCLFTLLLSHGVQGAGGDLPSAGGRGADGYEPSAVQLDDDDDGEERRYALEVWRFAP